MQNLLFSPFAIPDTHITLFDQSGQIVNPDPTNGYVGCFPDRTKLTIRVKVKEGKAHSCYTIDPSNMAKVPKRNNEGSYLKNLTVDCSSGVGQVARWPSNMICLDVEGQTYNIGLANQFGQFFFVIEEYHPDSSDLVEGMVVNFSLLRGVGTVVYKPGFDAKIHYSALKRSKVTGLRMVRTYDLLEWDEKDVVQTDSSTTFRYEIKKAVNLSQPE